MVSFELGNPEGKEVVFVNSAHVRTVRQAPPEHGVAEVILGMSDGSEIWVRGQAKDVAAAIEADLKKMANVSG